MRPHSRNQYQLYIHRRLNSRFETYCGHLEDGAALVKKAVDGFSERADQTGLAESRLLEARILRYRGFYRQSLALLEKVTETLVLNAQSQYRYDFVLEKSISLIMIGCFQEAEVLLKHALEKLEYRGDFCAIAHLLEGLGNTYYLQGEYTKALQICQKRSEVLAGLDLPDYYTQNYIAAIYQEWGELEQALEYARRSVEFKENLGLIDTLPSAYYQLGDIYLNRHEFRKAEENFRRAIALIESNSGECFFLILNKAYLVICLSLQGCLSEGQLIAEEALEQAQAPGGGNRRFSGTKIPKSFGQ